MDISAARGLAIQLMQKHGLTKKGWRFKYDSAERRFGLCSYDKKRIQLSMPLTKLNGVEEVQNTVLHEIAHALVGPGKGHGPEWKEMAIKVGATPERCCGADVKVREGKYKYQCPQCKRTISRHKAVTEQVGCKPCCTQHSNGSFDARFALVEMIYHYLKSGDPIQPGDQYKAQDGEWKELTQEEYNEWKGFRDYYDPEEGMSPFRRLVPAGRQLMPANENNGKPIVIELADVLGRQKLPSRVTFTDRRKKFNAEKPPEPQKELTLAEFWDQLDQHDWFSSFSDDPRFYNAGTADFERLRALAKGKPDFEQMMDAFKQHHFSRESWKTEKQPKPPRPGTVLPAAGSKAEAPAAAKPSTGTDSIIDQIEKEFRPHLAEDDPIRMIIRGLELTLQQGAAASANIIRESLQSTIKETREKMALESRQKLKELNDEMMRYTRNAVTAIQHGRNEANSYLIGVCVELKALSQEIGSNYFAKNESEVWKQRSFGAIIALVLLAVGYFVGKGGIK